MFPQQILSSINVGFVGSNAKVKTSNGGALESALTFTSTNEYSNPFTLRLYLKTGEGEYVIPRGIVNGLGTFGEHPDWDTFNNQFTSTLKPEQNKSVEEVLNYFGRGDTYGGILESPTGTGKTVMGLSIALILGRKTLVIVPTTYLLSQWVQRIQDHTDIKESEIGIVQGPRCELEGKKIVVAMVHSLVQREYPDNLYTDFGLVIFDEVHTLGAETFSKVCPMFLSRYRLGLSATPKRKDGMTDVFKYHIGDVITKSKKISVVPKVYILQYTNANLSEIGCINKWNGKFNSARWLTRVSSNDARNVMLAKLVVQAYERGHKVLLLTDRLEMVHTLSELLAWIPSVGKITAKIKEPDKDIILATYGSAALGMDIPQLSCVILATPRVDIVQPIGRVLREKEGKRQPEIIDIVDKSCKPMVGWGRARYKRYKQFTDDIVYKEITQ